MFWKEESMSLYSRSLKNILLFFISVFWISSVAAQEMTVQVILTDALQERNEVPYTRPMLSWDDFNGKPDHRSEWTAMTYSGIKLRYEYKHQNKQHSVKVMLYPYMDKARSWYKEEGHNDYTLAHEQRHFDITMLITHQLAEELRQAHYSTKNFAQQINNIHEQYLEKLRQMQDDYDKETNHGIHKVKQGVWNRKIARELGKLE